MRMPAHNSCANFVWRDNYNPLLASGLFRVRFSTLIPQSVLCNYPLHVIAQLSQRMSIGVQLLFAGAKHENTGVGEQVKENTMLLGEWKSSRRRLWQLEELGRVESALCSDTNRLLSFTADISAAIAK